MTQLCQDLTELHLEKYLENSGHFISQMGNYEDCVDLGFTSAYFKANFINNNTKLPATMYTGLCLPHECSS